MIVLSAGMPKAGSGWYFNLTNDLLIAAGYQDVREIRRRYRLQAILRFQNCNIGKLSWRNLGLLTIPHLLGNTFVVKTHQSPSTSLRRLISGGIIRATYIYRDPRDVVISAFEHGQRLRSRGETHTFGQLHSLTDAILLAAHSLTIWEQWLQPGLALTVRYEDLVADPVQELGRLAEFLSVRVPYESLCRTVAAYHPARITADENKVDALHFNQGVVGRFRAVLKPEELALCQQQLGGYIKKMGYAE
jgi:sulfotransferase family protein